MITQEHFFAAVYERIYLEHFGVIEVREPRENSFFSPLQNCATKFVRPANGAKWTCAECGAKRGRAWFWTSMLPFQAGTFGFAIQLGKLREAWTPVCADHPLAVWDGYQPQHQEAKAHG